MNKLNHTRFLGWVSALFGALLPVTALFAATGYESITSNQPEYMPGDTATISGVGFEPNHSIVVQVIRVGGSIVTGDGTETPGSDTVTTDSSGHFAYNYILGGADRSVYNGTLTVNGIDNSSGTTLASTTFIDGDEFVLQGCDGRNSQQQCTLDRTVSGWAGGSHPIDGWTSGDAHGWQPSNTVPFRVRLDLQDAAAGTINITTEQDYSTTVNGSTVLAFDSAGDFYVGVGQGGPGTEGTLTKSCVLGSAGDLPTTDTPCIVSGPTYSGGDPNKIQYSWSILFDSSEAGNNDSKWALYWTAHLNDGAGAFPGPNGKIATTTSQTSNHEDDIKLGNDDDNDGVDNDDDHCSSTPHDESVDHNHDDHEGCGYSSFDYDHDGVTNGSDLCPNTPAGAVVDVNGCSAAQLDTDSDGVNDAVDLCPDTAAGAAVDSNGCSADQRDSDGDGVSDAADLCPNTAAGATVDANGCSADQQDSDGDGVNNGADLCPNTAAGAAVDANGCSYEQQDADGDGVSNGADLCPNTAAGATVDSNGCSAAQRDTDGDGVSDAADLCPNTAAGATVDANGCSAAQLDSDGDGVSDAADLCPNTAAGAAVDSNGCSADQRDTDGDGVSDAADLCPGTAPGAAVDANGCSTDQLDSDGDGVSNAADLCPNTPAGVAVDTNGCSADQLSKLPDLVLTQLSTGNTTANAGSTSSIVVTTRVENHGGDMASASRFVIPYHFSTDTVYGNEDDVISPTTQVVGTMLAGSWNLYVKALTLPVTIPAGTYYVCAKADDDATGTYSVFESDETNNIRCTTTTFVVPIPDLKATSLTNYNSSVHLGGTIKVVDELQNVGGSQALNFTIGYVLSTNSVIGDGDDIMLPGTRSLASLNSGATSKVAMTLTVPTTVLPGVYYVGVIDDVGNVVTESNEGNNTLKANTILTVSP